MPTTFFAMRGAPTTLIFASARPRSPITSSFGTRITKSFGTRRQEEAAGGRGLLDLATTAPVTRAGIAPPSAARGGGVEWGAARVGEAVQRGHQGAAAAVRGAEVHRRGSEEKEKREVKVNV